MEQNKARNRYYMLPLLLGIIGLVYHIRKHPKDAFIVFIMFFMTGLAIAIYLNMPPRQPRERDYAFVGSFSFFAIWIGFAVMALAEWVSKLFKNNSDKAYKVALPVAFVACMAAAPCLMASENWDDHDRSQKYAARDFAQNYLKSINNNGILITFGDNDTFPLWYAQEVEGTRTDVRILNFTLSGMYWYVEQLYNKLYESEALPFTLPKEFYGLGNDATYILDRSNEYLEVTDVLALLRDHPDRFTMGTGDDKVTYLPTKRFKITLDIPALVEKGVIPVELADKVNPEIRWEINKQVLYRHELMLLDIIGTNKFMRDINIMNPNTQGIPDVFPPVRNYSVQDGMNYKFLPYPRQQRFTDRTADYFINGVDGEPLKWGNLGADIYVDPISENMGIVQRQTMMILAADEIEKGHVDNARALLDNIQEAFPAKNFPVDVYSVYIYTGNNTHVDGVDLYQKVYGEEAATQLWKDAFEYYRQEVTYLQRFSGDKMQGVRSMLQGDLQIVGLLSDMARLTLKNDDLAQEAEALLNQFGPYYSNQ